MAGGGDIGIYIGAFANDTAATAFFTNRGFTQSRGYLYYDSTLAVMKMWDGSVWVGIKIFGAQFSQSSSDSESTTTNTAFQQKLRHTTPSLPSGNYLISYSCELSNTAEDTSEVQVQINDATTIGVHTQHMTYATYLMCSGFYYASSISGVQNIDIDYRAAAGGGTAGIRRARVTVLRVS